LLVTAQLPAAFTPNEMPGMGVAAGVANFAKKM
jgi:hypothetical protein